MIVIKGGVTTPKGFLASGVKAGIKKSGRKDLALLYSEVPAVASGAFTSNRFQASPVKISRNHIANKMHQAIIVNSGNANCGNGRIGDRDAISMAKFIAGAMALGPKEVLVASTGIIGRYMPIGKVQKATPELVNALSAASGSKFAETIMTTDTKKKELAVKVKIGGCVVTIGGACKGVGMIYPEVVTEKHATMLSFITTDAAITKRMLAASLDEAIGDSFNMISVDGDMSTNDSCFIMANGLACNKPIVSRNKDYCVFVEALKYVSMELAKMMVRDGEGATRFVEITVAGAKTVADAKAVARKVSTSNLLKCAIYGRDPNWGRVAAAAGASGVAFDPDKTDIYLGGTKVLANGQSVKSCDLNKVRKAFNRDTVGIRVDLKSGKASAKAWTCDFSHEYVSINSEYST